MTEGTTKEALFISRIFLIDTKKQIQQPTCWYDV